MEYTGTAFFESTASEVQYLIAGQKAAKSSQPASASASAYVLICTKPNDAVDPAKITCHLLKLNSKSAVCGFVIRW
jgi:hypothetical protein